MQTRGLVFEAVVVGVLIVIGGSVVAKVLEDYYVTDVPPICRGWNRYHVMEISLFLTGFFVHIFCEMVGVNRWFCKYGRACARR